MTLAKTTSTCPYCKETIAAGAIKCKHCQSDLGGAKKAKAGLFTRYNNFRYGFLTGVIFTVLVILLGYLQFTHE